MTSVENPSGSASASGEQAGDFASLYLSSVTIENFRGIVKCRLELEPDLTILVGANNVGKSRVMRAVALALGAVQADKDDFTIGSSEEPVIDVVLAPVPQGGAYLRSGADDDSRDAATEVFDYRIVARLRWVSNISEQPERQRFAWRTRVLGSLEGYGARTERVELVYDYDRQDWNDSRGSPLTREQRSIVAADLVETGRDLAGEMANQWSAIRRVLDDLEVEDGTRERIEEELRALGVKVVDASRSMREVRDALVSLEHTVDGVGAASLQPLPVRLEELARAVSVELDGGTGPIPMRLHGAGARSLASLQVQGVLYDRRLGRDGVEMRPHPVSLIEEPEAHLHPQAQFELPGLLEQIRGQVIVTSHSSHLVTVAEPRSLRLLRRTPELLDVIDLHPTDKRDTPRARRPKLHAEEMERLRRTVERPFGELVFASAVVLGDGATERALIPPLARHCLGTRAQGLCVVDPGSMNTDMALAVVKFAELVGLPVILFADDDSTGRRAVNKILHRCEKLDKFDKEQDVIWTSSGNVRAEATESMFLEELPDVCVQACRQLNYEGERDRKQLLKFMTDRKGVMGSFLAAELVRELPWESHESSWPEPLRRLMVRLSDVLPQ